MPYNRVKIIFGNSFFEFLALNAHAFERNASSLIPSRFFLRYLDILLQFLRRQFQAEIIVDIRVRRDIGLLLLRDRRESLEDDVLRPHAGEDFANVRRAVARPGELRLDVIETASPSLR